MIVTGFNKRRIAAQDSFSFLTNISVNNAMSSFDFGFSGESGVQGFSFRSGKIYDMENRYVWSYIANESIKISGDFGPFNYSYYINDTSIAFGNKSMDYYKYIYFNPKNTTGTISFNIIADQPLYDFIYSGQNIFSGNPVRIQVINKEENPNRTFTFFSGNLQANTEYFDFSGSGLPGLINGGNLTGAFDFYIIPKTTNDNLSLFTCPCQFYTDFGIINKEFNINYRDYYIYFAELLESFTGIVFVDSGISDIKKSFIYNLYIQNENKISPLYVSLKDYGNNTGQASGFFDFTGIVNGNLIGNFIESGNVTGTITGNLLSVETNQSGEYLQYLFSSGYSTFQWATGYFNSTVILPVTGIINGPTWTGFSIIATGRNISGTLSGYIVESGFLCGTLSGRITGFFGNNINTGFIQENQNPYCSGFIATGNFSTNYKITGVSQKTRFQTGIGQSYDLSFAVFDTVTGITDIYNVTKARLIQGNTGIHSGTIENRYYSLIPRIPNDSFTLFGTVEVNSSFNSPITFYRLFDLDFTSNNLFITNTGYIKYSFSSFADQYSGSQILKGYIITCGNTSLIHPLTYPTEFSISGSNDNSNWDLLDNQTNVTFNSGEFKFYPITGNTGNNYYKYIKIDLANPTGSEIQISELCFLGYNTGQFYSSALTGGYSGINSGSFTGILYKDIIASGNYSRTLTGNMAISRIYAPTGRQLVSGNINKEISGVIFDGSGSHIFKYSSYTGIPSIVYNTGMITGDIKATGYLYFNGGVSNITDEGNININGLSLQYEPTGGIAPFFFSGLDNLVEIINKSESGFYGNSYSIVDCFASTSGDYIFFTSTLTGIDGNSQIITSNYNSVVPYFQNLTGGQNFYNEMLNTSTLTGTGIFKYINSGNIFGFYSDFFSGADLETGYLFFDSFYKTWTGFTGIKNNLYNLNYNGIDMLTGYSIIESGFTQKQITFEFFKFIPYNLNGNAIFIISGLGFLKTGII